MKILFTGVTGRQAKNSRISRQKIYDSRLIYEVLKDLGHEVSWKKTTINEDFDQYDLAIVALGPAASFNSGNLLNAVWIINKLPTILHFEDWKISGLLKTYKGCVDNPEKTILKKIKSGYFYSDAEDYKNHLPELVSNFNRILNLKESGHKCIIPGFKWGDKSIIKEVLGTDNITAFDLTPKVITKKFTDGSNSLWEEPIVKQKKYFLASLGDHKSWIKRMKLGWEVDTTNKGKDLTTEYDVFKEGEKYWGILAPEYDHSGSGWFRIRFVYSALGDSCMICSPKDAEQLGEPFNIDIQKFETLSENELKQIARDQKSIIISHMTTYDELKETFKDILT